MSRRIVIGTAGHIDHGKSRLVRALTGTDPDRLEEERRRGITIDLGFAHLALPDGSTAGVVDVPGHERFVRTMVAGAAGIDLVMLVVAADEGVMPQTLEHLDVCRLLGVPRGVVALTKTDLLSELEPGWLELVQADLAEALAGTFLEDAPVVPVSAASGEGLDDLVGALAEVAATAPARDADGPLFLPVDRAFVMKGFGTVATGTLLSGSLAVGGTVDVAPAVPDGEGVRLRGLQVHGAAVERAEAGQRTAVNLAGLERAGLSRGAVLVEPGAQVTGRLLDVRVEALPWLERPIRQRARLLVHLGTAHAEATVVLLEKRAVGAGEGSYAQLELDRPLAALPGQPFILRGARIHEGRGRTVAGGRVLGLARRRRRPSRASALDGMAELAGGDPAVRIETVVRLAGVKGVPEASLPWLTGLPARRIGRLLQDLASRRVLMVAEQEPRTFVHAGVLEALQGQAAEALEAHHAADPVSTGLSKEALRSGLEGPPSPRLFHKVLQELGERVSVEGDRVRLQGRGEHLSEDDSEASQRLVDHLAAASLTPPRPQDAAAELGLDVARTRALVVRLAGEGRLIKVKDDLFFAPEAIAELEARLLAYLDGHGEITTQAFKELTGATRKHAIPLSEYFDRQKVTLRIGDKRVRRGAPRTAS